MFSLFPQLFDFWILAPLLWRLALALNYFWLGSRIEGRGRNVFRPLFWLGGGLLLLGAATQAAAPALVLALVATRLVRPDLVGPSRLFNAPYLILLIIGTVSLIITGAGWLAIDQPF